MPVISNRLFVAIIFEKVYSSLTVILKHEENCEMEYGNGHCRIKRIVIRLSHSPKSFACDNRVPRLRTFVRTLRGICESCAYEFSPARATRVKKIIKHARAITKCSCTWNFPSRLRLFEHPAVLTVSPNVYSLESIVRAGNIQPLAKLCKAERIYWG